MVVLITIIKVSDGTDLGGEFSGSIVTDESAVGLLLASGGDKSVDLLNLDPVELLDGVLDGGLVGGLLNEEDDGVLLRDVHILSSLGVNGLLDDIEKVRNVFFRDGSERILGASLLSLSNRSLESGGLPDLSLLGLMASLLNGFGDFLSGSFSRHVLYEMSPYLLNNKAVINTPFHT